MVKFGTSGLRGLAVDLTEDVVTRYVSAFLRTVPSKGEVLVGQDLRESSPGILSAVATACASERRQVVNCGVLPTPALALASCERELAAIMITGSHIPANRNGLKFYSPAGEITKADERAILEACHQRPSLKTEAEIGQDASVLQGFFDRYVRFYAERPLSGMRIGVYQHSSVARDLLPDLLEAVGASAVSFERSESFVPVDTEAFDERTRVMLAGWTRRERLDAIVSTDGDADRPLLVDDAGHIVPGDVIGPLTAASLGVNVIVTPVSSNTIVERCNAFSEVKRCKIGSPFVISEIVNHVGTDPIAGYEANGGFILGSEIQRGEATITPLLTRDFALPLLELLRMCCIKGKTVAALVNGLPHRRTASDRLQNVPQEVSRLIVDEIAAEQLSLIPKEHGTIESIDLTDGVRLTLSSERIVHVRPSGNAPELRCYVETEGQRQSDMMLHSVLNELSMEVSRRL